DTNPSAPRNWSAQTASSSATTATETAARAGAARTAIRWAVLTVAVNVVRNLIVGRDVIDLAVWKLNPLPALPARNRETDAGIVRYRHAIGLGRIDPNVMIVTAGTVATDATTAANTCWYCVANHGLAAVGRTT